MKIYLYVSRHGLSCHNAISAYDSSFMQWKKHVMIDPPLTNWAIGTFNADAPKFDFRNEWKIDGIMCSTLLRAQMTADLMYPANLSKKKKNKIFVVPYISEFSTHGGGTASGIENQRKWHAAYGGGNDIDYRFVANEELYYSKPNYESFFTWLNQNLPALLKAMGIPKSKKEVHLALVSHSVTMEKFFISQPEEKEIQLVDHFGTVVVGFGYKDFLWRLECPMNLSFHEKLGPCPGLVFPGYPLPPQELLTITDGRGNCPTIFDKKL